MHPLIFLAVLLGLTAFGYQAGRHRSLALVGGLGNARALHSRPSYYGAYAALWTLVPALLVLLLWLVLEQSVVTEIVLAGLPPEVRDVPPDRLNLLVNDLRNLVKGNIVSAQAGPAMQAAVDHYRSLLFTSRAALGVSVLVLAAGGMLLARTHIAPSLRARNRVEGVVRGFLIGSSSIAILTTIGIVLSVLFESIRFFQVVPVTEFLFGTRWSPQLAIRADQVGSSGAFGAVPLFTGTLLVAAVAMLVAVPIGLMAAIYLSEYASKHFRSVAKPLLEVLAGVPTVVYGFFAALVVAPLVRDAGQSLGLEVASESALGAGLVMGVMIIPFVSSISDDVINAVPQSMRDGSYALGATSSETIRRVVIPAALPGIVGGILLAVSRAIGETMIVVMAAGLSANLTANPLEAVTTVTVQIVTLLVGDQEFDSPKTLAAFALGLALFVMTLALNVIALHVVRKYREQYE